RMADVRRLDAVLAVEGLLKRKDDDHAVDVLRDLLNASLLPRPQLRRDVVDDANAQLPAAPRHAQIESGVVDEQHRVGLLKRDASEKERAEDDEERADPFGARLLPEQREENAGGYRVEEHQHDVIAEKAHSFRPCAMSNASTTSSRFIRPAVMVKAVPCSKVMEVMSPCTPMPAAIQ